MREVAGETWTKVGRGREERERERERLEEVRFFLDLGFEKEYSRWKILGKTFYVFSVF